MRYLELRTILIAVHPDDLVFFIENCLDEETREKYSGVKEALEKGDLDYEVEWDALYNASRAYKFGGNSREPCYYPGKRMYHGLVHWDTYAFL